MMAELEKLADVAYTSAPLKPDLDTSAPLTSALTKTQQMWHDCIRVRLLQASELEVGALASTLLASGFSNPVQLTFFPRHD